MERIKTESISIVEDDWCIPREMITLFDFPHAKEDRKTYCLLEEKGILFGTHSYLDYESINGKTETYMNSGLLIYLRMSKVSFFMSIDEANDWIESLPYGKIIVDGKDYTPAAWIYSAISYLFDDVYFDYRDPPKRRIMFPERIQELLGMLESVEDEYEEVDQIYNPSSQTSNDEIAEENTSGFTTVEADELPF